jgi:hypothetical protein
VLSDMNARSASSFMLILSFFASTRAARGVAVALRRGLLLILPASLMRFMFRGHGVVGNFCEWWPEPMACTPDLDLEKF